MHAPINIAYTERYLDWKLGENHPTNPIRAKLAVNLLKHYCDAGEVKIFEPAAAWTAEGRIRLIHSDEYVDEVKAGLSGEWMDEDKLLGATAALMFQGTSDLVDLLLKTRAAGGERAVYFNPQGAKHHAHYDYSAGFCVFNDMAWAAKYLTAVGKRVAYVDWDVHHGDGVEELLFARQDIPTHSIHEGGIFPGTGWESVPTLNVFNYPLEHCAGDEEFLAAMDAVLAGLREFRPDVVLLACGADGLAGDPLASLNYTLSGIGAAARMIGEYCGEADADLLVGGAGGYQPETETPVAWAITVLSAAEEMGS